MKLAAIDVDLTVVDSLTPWLQWYEAKTGIAINPQQSQSYDLVPMMKALAAEKGISIDPFKWWHQPDLYDYHVPVHGSMKAIKRIMEAGVNVVFVSHCVPSHEESKKQLLNTFFEGCHFISTNKKGLVDYDFIVDDYLHVLEEAKKLSSTLGRDAQHIHFTGINKWGYDENVVEPFLDLRSDCWESIADHIIEAAKA